MTRKSKAVDSCALQVRYVKVHARPDERLAWGEDPDHPRPIGYFQGFGVTAQDWNEACSMVELYVTNDIAGEILGFKDLGEPDFHGADTFLLPYIKESKTKGIWYKTGCAFYSNDDEDEIDSDDDDPIPISREEADSIFTSRNPEAVADALSRLGGTSEDIMWAAENALRLLRDSNLELAEVAASYLGYVIGYSDLDETTRLVLFGKCNAEDVDESLSQLVEEVAVSSPVFRSGTGSGRIS